MRPTDGHRRGGEGFVIMVSGGRRALAPVEPLSRFV